MRPIFLYNEATGQQFGYTAMNHLLDPHVDEAFRQIHRAEDKWEDDFIDFDVREIVDEPVREPSGAQRPQMWSSHWRPFAYRDRAWRPNDSMRKMTEDIEEYFSSSGASEDNLAIDGCHDDYKQVDDRRVSTGASVNGICGHPVPLTDHSGAVRGRQSAPGTSLVCMNHLDSVASINSERCDTSDDEDAVLENLKEALPVSPIRESLLVRFDKSFFDEDIWSSKVDVQLSHRDEPQSIIPPQLAEEDSFAVLSSEDMIGSIKPSQSDNISIGDETEVTLRAMCNFTDHYVSQISQGYAEHMTVTRDKILEDHGDDEGAPAFGFLGKTVDDVAEFAQMLYVASSTNAPRMRKKLHTLYARIAAIASSVKCRTKQNDLQSAIFNRAWDMMYACMEDIDDAHQRMFRRPGLRNFADEIRQTERSIWYDWLANIHASIRAADEDGSSLLMQDFVFVSLHWWKRKTNLAMQRRKGRRGARTQF